MRTRAFTIEQAIEIIDRNQAGETLGDLVAVFGRRKTVREILLGEIYRDLFHVECRACYCPRCKYDRLCDSNYHIAEAAAWVTVRCALCPATGVRMAGAVLRTHGQALCDRCDTRRS